MLTIFQVHANKEIVKIRSDVTVKEEANSLVLLHLTKH